MKLAISCLSLATLLVFGAAEASRAVPVGSPSPIAGYGPDDGTQIFAPTQQVLSFELFDPAGFFAPSEFGFYFASDPGSLIPIFEAADQDPTNTTGSGAYPQYAAIDFAQGIVFDVDGNAVQNTFAAQDGNVGFYYSLDFGQFNQVLRTEDALNGGLDLVATFPRLGDPYEYLLMFQDAGTGDFLSIDVVRGVSAIPEPSAAMVFAAGTLIVVARLGRHRKD